MDILFLHFALSSHKWMHLGHLTIIAFCHYVKTSTTKKSGFIKKRFLCAAIITTIQFHFYPQFHSTNFPQVNKGLSSGFQIFIIVCLVGAEITPIANCSNFFTTFYFVFPPPYFMQQERKRWIPWKNYFKEMLSIGRFLLCPKADYLILYRDIPVCDYMP